MTIDREVVKMFYFRMIYPGSCVFAKSFYMLLAALAFIYLTLPPMVHAGVSTVEPTGKYAGQLHCHSDKVANKTYLGVVTESYWYQSGTGQVAGIRKQVVDCTFMINNNDGSGFHCPGTELNPVAPTQDEKRIRVSQYCASTTLCNIVRTPNDQCKSSEKWHY